MATEESLHEAARLRFRFQMNNRLRLESLAAISKVFRDFGEPIEDELLASMVFAVPEELIGEYSRFAEMAASRPLKRRPPGGQPSKITPKKRRPSGGPPPKNLRPPGGERVQKRRPPGGTPAKTSRPPTASRPTGSRPTGSRPTGSRPTGSRPTGSRPTGSRPTWSRPPKGKRPPGGTRPAYEGGRPTTTKRTKVSAKRPPGGKRPAPGRPTKKASASRKSAKK